VVTTLFRSEATVEEFYARITAAASAVTPSFELVFVDDGSPDGSGTRVRRLAEGDARVVLVELSRNFGHHQAATAGLRHARGQRVFILDVDLEEQPEWLPEFAAELERTAADVVYGVSAARTGSAFRRWSGGLFWWLFNRLSETRVTPNPCTVRIMRRRYVDAVLTLPDRSLFLAGNYAWLGFRQIPRIVEKKARKTRSNYTLGRLAALFIDAITSFTSYPLRLIFAIGGLIAGASVAAGTGLVLLKLARPESISMGWPSVMVSIWFLGGVIIAFLGVIGIYLSKIFNEAKGRPLYVVREIVRGAAGSGGGA
jgi:putative glycosyltransferase